MQIHLKEDPELKMGKLQYWRVQICSMLSSALDDIRCQTVCLEGCRKYDISKICSETMHKRK